MTSPEETSRVNLLMTSARIGNLHTIRNLVEEKGTNINSLSQCGDNALCVASVHNQELVVGYLLAKGAQVDLKTGGDNLRTRGQTALCFAAAEGNVGICKLLLEHGADRNLKTEWGRITHAVVESDNPDCIDLIFDQDYSSIDEYDRSGVTPLMAAMSSGRRNSTKYLLEKGADYKKFCEVGDPTLMSAINVDGANCMEILLDYVKSKETSESFKKYLNQSNIFTKQTALHKAYRYGRRTEVEILLKYGADPSVRDVKGKTPKDLENKDVDLWNWSCMSRTSASNDFDRKILEGYKVLQDMLKKRNNTYP